MLRQLSMQARSRQELADALRRKNVPEEVATAVLNRMEEVGLIDDADFAGGWVASRQQRRYLSKAVLRRELHHKGIDGDVIDEAVSTVGPDQEFAAALALAEKKMRAMTKLDQHVQRRRVAGALARRGFTSATVGAVLTEVFGAAGRARQEWAEDGGAP